MPEQKPSTRGEKVSDYLPKDIVIMAPPLAGHAAAGVRGSCEGVSNRQESSGRPRLAVITQIADLARDEPRRIAATITKLPQYWRGDASS
jgi:hypothetical protein